MEEENTKHRHYFLVIKLLYLFFLAMIQEGKLSVVLLFYMRKRIWSFSTLLISDKQLHSLPLSFSPLSKDKVSICNISALQTKSNMNHTFIVLTIYRLARQGSPTCIWKCASAICQKRTMRIVLLKTGIDQKSSTDFFLIKNKPWKQERNAAS